MNYRSSQSKYPDLTVDLAGFPLLRLSPFPISSKGSIILILIGGRSKALHSGADGRGNICPSYRYILGGVERKALRYHRARIAGEMGWPEFTSRIVADICSLGLQRASLCFHYDYTIADLRDKG